MSYLPTLGPCSKLNPFPKSVSIPVSCSDSNSSGDPYTLPNAKGFLSSDLQLAFLFQGPHIEVLRAKTNERLAAWKFGSIESAESTEKLARHRSYVNEITCVAELLSPSSYSSELHSTRGPSTGNRGALIGLANGHLCLLDLKSSKITRCINIGHRVTSIQVVSANGGPFANQRAFAEELMFFFGIAAVGTSEGRIFLVDLALDGYDFSQLDGRSHDPEDPFVSTEQNPAKLFRLQGSVTNIADIRQKLMRRGQHLSLCLNDGFLVERTFQHKATATGVSTYFPEEEVSVCATKYIPHLSSLAVGFNYGSWQLWNLSRLWLEFSSNYMGTEALSVVDFTFQEPENDPKNFCYIWTVQSNDKFETLVEKADIDNFSSIKLYALAYDNRDEGDQYGVLYTGLTSCTLRYEHILSSNPADDTEVKGSLALTCSTLGFSSMSSISTNRILTGGGGGSESSNDISDPEDTFSNLGLSIFSWEVLPLNQEGSLKQSQYYLGIFDLNAWYQSQMPSNYFPETNANEQCPFFSVCSLDEVLLNSETEFSAEEEQGRRKNRQELVQLINLAVDVDSLSRYQAFFSAEQHYYPSSLAFDLTCVLDRGFVYATNMGLQRKVLSEFQIQGGRALVEPESLFQLCQLSGLIEQLPGEVNVLLSEQRSKLLTVALENHLITFLNGCIEEWNDGKYATVGCSLKIVLDWAWEKVTKIKQNIDRATKPLFDHSCLELNHETRRSLLQKAQQLHHLCSVFDYLLQNAGVATEEGIQQLETKQSVCFLVNQYLQVIIWFFNAGLLPEVSDEANSDNSQLSNNPYPLGLLISMYQTKRRRMKANLSKFSSQIDLPPLVVDGLCQELGEKIHLNFEREGGDGNYPPPSLFSLLSIYLIPDADTEIFNQNIEHCKNRLVQYIFLDMASYLNGEKWSGLVENLIKFPSAFNLPPSMIKLTQAFWLLDHEDFDEALTMLLDPLISNSDISLWQHRTILLAFLIQDHPKLALKYARIRQPPQKESLDLQLNIAILLANGMVHEAFQFQRQRRKNENASSMLQYFFERAEELEKLDTVLQLSLTMLEEQELKSFLKKSTRFGSQEILLMYYLQRNRYSEAMTLNEQLNARPGAAKDKNQTRHAIMERFSNTNLMSSTLMHRFSKPSSLAERMEIKSRGPVKPVPLSVEIRSKEFNPVFHSNSIHEEMERKKREFGSEMENTNKCYTPFRPRHQRFGMRKLNEEEEMFSKNSHSVTFPKEVSLSESSLIDLDASSRSIFNVSSTSPEFKRNLNEYPSLTMSQVKDMNRTRQMILSVLETPKFKKSSKKKSLVGMELKETKIATPQSILKIKKLMSKQSPSPSETSNGEKVNRILNLDDDDYDDDEDEENWLMSSKVKNKNLEGILINSQDATGNRSRESTPGKSLRFNVPKTYPEIKDDEESSINEEQQQRLTDKEPLMSSPEEVKYDEDDDDDDIQPSGIRTPRKDMNTPDLVEEDSLVTLPEEKSVEEEDEKSVDGKETPDLTENDPSSPRARRLSARHHHPKSPSEITQDASPEQQKIVEEEIDSRSKSPSLQLNLSESETTKISEETQVSPKQLSPEKSKISPEKSKLSPEKSKLSPNLSVSPKKNIPAEVSLNKSKISPDKKSPILSKESVEATPSSVGTKSSSPLVLSESVSKTPVGSPSKGDNNSAVKESRHLVDPVIRELSPQQLKEVLEFSNTTRRSRSLSSSSPNLSPVKPTPSKKRKSLSYSSRMRSPSARKEKEPIEEQIKSPDKKKRRSSISTVSSPSKVEALKKKRHQSESHKSSPQKETTTTPKRRPRSGEMEEVQGEKSIEENDESTAESSRRRSRSGGKKSEAEEAGTSINKDILEKSKLAGEPQRKTRKSDSKTEDSSREENVEEKSRTMISQTEETSRRKRKSASVSSKIVEDQAADETLTKARKRKSVSFSNRMDMEVDPDLIVKQREEVAKRTPGKPRRASSQSSKAQSDENTTNVTSTANEEAENEAEVSTKRTPGRPQKSVSQSSQNQAQDTVVETEPALETKEESTIETETKTKRTPGRPRRSSSASQSSQNQAQDSVVETEPTLENKDESTVVKETKTKRTPGRPKRSASESSTKNDPENVSIVTKTRGERTGSTSSQGVSETENVTEETKSKRRAPGRPRKSASNTSVSSATATNPEKSKPVVTRRRTRSNSILEDDEEEKPTDETEENVTEEAKSKGPRKSRKSASNTSISSSTTNSPEKSKPVATRRRTRSQSILEEDEEENQNYETPEKKRKTTKSETTPKGTTPRTSKRSAMKMTSTLKTIRETEPLSLSPKEIDFEVDQDIDIEEESEEKNQSVNKSKTRTKSMTASTSTASPVEPKTGGKRKSASQSSRSLRVDLLREDQKLKKRASVSESSRSGASRSSTRIALRNSRLDSCEEEDEEVKKWQPFSPETGEIAEALKKEKKKDADESKPRTRYRAPNPKNRFEKRKIAK